MTITKNILAHSCRIKKDGRPRDLVVSGERYVGELGVNLAEQEWYYALPKKCRCKRYVSVAEATEFVASGWAVWILRFKRVRGEVRLNESGGEDQIWIRVVRERVPRVDLISRADIERSVLGSEKKSKHYRYNREKQRYEVITEVPEGYTKKQWMEDAENEVKFERRIRKQYSQYIQQCHDLTLGFRSRLVVPFQPDPFEGRTLFSFSKDERTVGGKGLDNEVVAV